MTKNHSTKIYREIRNRSNCHLGTRFDTPYYALPSYVKTSEDRLSFGRLLNANGNWIHSKLFHHNMRFYPVFNTYAFKNIANRIYINVSYN